MTDSTATVEDVSNPLY
jgi:hypothetical protein